MKAIKKYFEDYAAAEEVCKEFRKKHWLGNFVILVIGIGLTYGIFYGPGTIKNAREAKEKKLSK